MELYDLRAFADAAGVFNFKSHRPYADSWFSWRAEKKQALQSRFANLSVLRSFPVTFSDFVFAKIVPVVTDVRFAANFSEAAAKAFYSYFLTHTAPKPQAAPVVAKRPELRIVETLPAPEVAVVTAPASTALPASLKVAALLAKETEIETVLRNVAETVFQAVTGKPRKTLTLKARPVIEDLGVVFAQEMRKQAPSIPAHAVPVQPAPVQAVPAQQVAAEAAPEIAAAKPRKTLSLKTKVELPVIASLSKASSGVDLAAAFKSEMKVVTERKADAADLHAAFAEKRKHPLSTKSWKELAAEAETLQQKKAAPSMDLGAAFKREMQAVMAAEERLSAKPAAAQPAEKKAPKARTLAA